MYLEKTYKNWKEEIVNFYENKIDNRFMEDYNNKIQIIKRDTYGNKKNLMHSKN